MGVACAALELPDQSQSRLQAMFKAYNIAYKIQYILARHHTITAPPPLRLAHTVLRMPLIHPSIKTGRASV